MATAIRRRAPSRRVVVVGNSQQLSITKQVAVVGGGAAVPGAQLEYVVRVTNIASVPAINVVITDNLNASQPGQLAYVNGSATMNGSAAGVTVRRLDDHRQLRRGQRTAGAGRRRGAQVPGHSRPRPGAKAPSSRTPAWSPGTSRRRRRAPACRSSSAAFPASPSLNGSAWHDADFDNARDAGERALAGWAVDLYRDGQLVHSGLTTPPATIASSASQPNNVSKQSPTSCGSVRRARVRTPRCSAWPSRRSRTECSGSRDIVVPSGANLQGLNLPIHPNGVVYNSIARIPVAGATLTLLDARSTSPLAGGLLRRCGPAGAGHARGRLLQVRRQLQRPGVPERR